MQPGVESGVRGVVPIARLYRQLTFARCGRHGPPLGLSPGRRRRQWSVTDLYADDLGLGVNTRQFQLNFRGVAVAGEDANPIEFAEVYPTKQPVAG